jgi:hypothetical protein
MCRQFFSAAAGGISAARGTGDVPFLFFIDKLRETR